MHKSLKYIGIVQFLYRGDTVTKKKMKIIVHLHTVVITINSNEIRKMTNTEPFCCFMTYFMDFDPIIDKFQHF